jgi:chromate transporter
MAVINMRRPYQQPSLHELFFAFLKLGATAFGGPAMVNQIRRTVIDKKDWLDPYDFDNGIALCQAIPGAIIMQVVAYTGLKIKGIKGATACFIGFGLPAFVLMFILSVLYKQFNEVTVVKSVLSNLHVVMAAIIANAAFNFGKRTLRNVKDFIIVAIAAALFLLKLHPALVVIMSAFFGLILSKSDDSVSTKRVAARTFRFFLFLLLVLAVSLAILFLLNKSYFILAITMLRIDLFAFGGGFAAVPVMFHEVIDIFNWMDKKTFMDGIVLGQVTPGSIIITATFVGYLKYGILGSIVATIFVFTPSFLILMGIVPFFDRLRVYPQFGRVIKGILCSFVGLLIIVTWHFGVDISWNFKNIVLAFVSFGVLFLHVDVIWIILASILFSILIL